MKSYIKKSVCVLMVLCGMSAAHAMEALNDETMQEVTGQAGADLSLKLSLNHDAAGNFACADLVYCRLAINLNNRYHDGTQDTVNATTGVITPSPTGRKQWLVMKGMQGTINFTEIQLDGEDVSYGGAAHAAIKLGFTPTKPIEIRNLGFQSLSIETDTCTELNANCSSGTTNLPGYLVPATLYPGTGFDSTKERGFMGINMHGNLSIGGSVKMFSCGESHARC